MSQKLEGGVRTLERHRALAGLFSEVVERAGEAPAPGRGLEPGEPRERLCEELLAKSTL